MSGRDGRWRWSSDSDGPAHCSSGGDTAVMGHRRTIGRSVGLDVCSRRWATLQQQTAAPHVGLDVARAWNFPCEFRATPSQDDEGRRSHDSRDVSGQPTGDEPNTNTPPSCPHRSARAPITLPPSAYSPSSRQAPTCLSPTTTQHKARAIINTHLPSSLPFFVLPGGRQLLPRHLFLPHRALRGRKRRGRHE